ncbi:MAG: chemotaxis protein CheW [Polyangiales bacterium]
MSGPSDSTVRVDVTLLDRLMNLVGELVLARNQILQLRAHTRDTAFAGTSQRLNLITTELQEGVMKTRMQPIGSVWNKFPRVVRDLAHLCNKQVRLDMEGAETELDRTIIEAIKDPLTHVIRNAIDHGIESPAVRAERSKPPVGRLTLRAFHEGGRVNIEVADDGAGIDPERIRQSAVRKGLVSAERAARMTDREAVALVFAPGFSTAAQVTNISGRGVGMDVVKTNIEKIGGSVDIQSAPGAGTTLKIRIPLTLAIVPALIIRDGGDRYAIPQVSLLELVRLEGAAARTGVESIHGAPVYRLRGNLLPLVYLHRTLGEAERPAAASDDDRVLNIVVLQADDRQFGLVVDGVCDTEEIVVKPLGKEIQGVTVFAGATIMGDGRVALILDVPGLAQRGGISVGARDRASADAKSAAGAESNKQALLLFEIEHDGRVAVPLSLVARLEEFPRERIERSGRRQVVQYRDDILPLIDVGQAVIGEPTANGAAALPTLVYTEQGRSVGLVVRRILDIVEEPLVIKRGSSTPGLLGAATIQGRVTDVLDVRGVIRAADPAFFDHPNAA